METRNRTQSHGYRDLGRDEDDLDDDTVGYDDESGENEKERKSK